MTETGTVASASRRKRSNPLVLLLVAIIAAGAFALGYYLALVQHPLSSNQEFNAELVTRTVGLDGSGAYRMSEEYRDANDDMLADPPPAEQCIDPPTLTFSYVTEEPASFQGVFTDLLNHISKATGKKVEYRVFKSPADELAAMHDGKLQIAGLNTGLVPVAVNLSGFIPFAALSSDDGTKSYHMEIIVPADSAIHNISELRGHDIVLTDPASNSGFKAPLAVLVKENGLRPVIDFRIRYSGSHETSIEGIQRKEYQAAAVASDRLVRAIAAGAIKKEDYRTIYKSSDYPTAGFGYVYNLKPELAAKIKNAIMDFDWKGTSLGKEFEASGQTKFAPVDYKKDWESVRKVDQEIRGVQNIQELMQEARSDEEQPQQPAPSTAPAKPPATAPAAPTHDGR